MTEVIALLDEQIVVTQAMQPVPQFDFAFADESSTGTALALEVQVVSNTTQLVHGDDHFSTRSPS